MVKPKKVHSPSEIIPTDYIHCFSYSGAGFMEPPFGLKAIWALRDEGKKFADSDRGIFQCNSCGAHFRHGDCLLHVPTGEYVFFGHRCTDKYMILADRDEWEMELKNTKARKAKLIQDAMVKESQDKIIADNPGLLEAFENQSRFIQDVKDKFERNGYLSERQIDAVLEAYERSKNEKKVKALLGKQSVTGTILKCATYNSGYGPCLKATIKVGDDSGFYIVWGTLARCLEDQIEVLYSKVHNCPPDLSFFKGFRVSFTATFKKSDKDESFAFFQRPTKASLVSTERVEV